VDSFLPPITLAEKRVTEIEDQVYSARPDDIQVFIREIEENRKTVSSLIRLLSGKNNVLSGFDKHHCVDPSHEDVDTGQSLKLYIGDIQDHLVSMLANLRQFESLLARSQETCIAGFEMVRIMEHFSSYSGMSQEEFLLRHYHLLFDLQASAHRYVSGATTQNSSQRSNC